MNQGTPETASQLEKVKRASKVVNVVTQIITAFTGFGLTFGIIGIIFAGSLRLEVGNGDFDVRGYRADDGEAAELLIVPQVRGERDGLLYREASAQDGTGASVPMTQRLRIGLGIMAVINAAVVLNLLGSVARLFAHYQRGEVFSHAIVNSIRLIGIALIAFPAVGILNSVVGSLLAIKLAPELGFVDVAIKFDMLFAALVVLMISWIMDVGRALQEERELTI